MYYRHISSERKWTDLRLREVWRYRDLIVLFTKRTFALSYKQTILGPLWLFLNPFLTSVVYTVVFGQIAGIRTDGLPQLLFYLGSTAIWTYFSSCVLGNSYTFHSNADIFGKVYFPRLTVPISQVASNLIRFAIQISMVLAVLVYYVVRREVQPHFAAWPLILLVLLQLGAMGMGVGLIISSLTVKYRDLSILVSFGVRLWMYATPVIYPLSQLPAGWIRTVVLLNPVTAPIELFRFALLGRGIFVWSSYLLSWVFTLCVLVFGMMVFTRVEKNFMDMV
ncbi:MAG: ABC transporter permease [Oscillospiraceae bacterium]|nr:ABC transporter permease [Oscillospiraceae bacterium]